MRRLPLMTALACSAACWWAGMTAFGSSVTCDTVRWLVEAARTQMPWRPARRLAGQIEKVAGGLRAGAHSWLERATGRRGSLIHSLHEPAYSRPSPRPAWAIASRLWAAVTPEPQ
jgi:hypothetical protein